MYIKLLLTKCFSFTGSIAYEKLVEALSKHSLLKGVNGTDQLPGGLPLSGNQFPP